MNALNPIIGIGACLVGQPVRYDGQSKRKNPFLEQLRQHAALRSFCPEMAIGLGVPRAPVRLVGELGQVRLMDSASQTQDYSSPITAYAANVLRDNPDLSGYIFVKASPSCGLHRVKRHGEDGSVVFNDAVGLFAAEVSKLEPLLPVEEDGRLEDDRLRENFVNRVYAYHDWKCFLKNPLSHSGLTRFWARYKYLLMSHHMPSYKKIGPLLADAREHTLESKAEQFIGLLMTGLRHRSTRKTHANVLQHIRGYLKRQLDSREKQEMDDLIGQYKAGYVPLVVPLTLLKHHFSRHPNQYISTQVYLNPSPGQLKLRNFVESG